MGGKREASSCRYGDGAAAAKKIGNSCPSLQIRKRFLRHDSIPGQPFPFGFVFHFFEFEIGFFKTLKP